MALFPFLVQVQTYPSCYENCIAVAAIQQDGTIAHMSNTGDWIDVIAPGFDIYSTLPQNCYEYKSGTSFATACVSGIAALLFSIAVDENGDGKLNDEVLLAIELGSRPAGTDSVNTRQINAIRSLNILLTHFEE